MRILQLSSARAIGGGERHLIDLSDALAARGHDLFLAVREESPIPAQLQAVPPDHVYNLKLRNALDVVSARRLSRLVRELRIDIVHAHLGRDYPLAALAVGRKTGAKLVITRHVMFPLSAAHRLTFRNVSRLIAVSRAVARGIENRGLIPADRIRVVHNGLDFEQINKVTNQSDRESVRNEQGLPLNRKLIASVGELNPLKGYEDFIRAASIVAREHHDVDFVVVGQERSTKSEYKQVLQALASDLGIGERVHFINWIARLPEFLRSIDLFVSASHTESFGLAILEAMMCGTAVVVTRTEGASEIVSDRQNGLLVDIGDPDALARAQLSLLDDEAERLRLAASAQLDARDRFSIQKMVAETEGVYAEAIDL